MKRSNYSVKVSTRSHNKVEPSNGLNVTTRGDAETLTRQKYDDVLNMVELEIKNASSKKRKSTRFLDLETYQSLLRRTVVSQPIDFEQYQALPPEPQYETPTYLECTEQQARKVLDDPDRVLWMPIVVRSGKKDRNKPANGGIPKFIQRLKSDGKKVDVLAGERENTYHKSRQPITLDTGIAIERLNNTNPEYPINFLNLRSKFHNPVPSCIANIDSFRILEDYPAKGSNGKTLPVMYSDISHCASFHVFGQRGAFSLPHIDHHGVFTTIQCDDGDKLWPIFPKLHQETFLAWARSTVGQVEVESVEQASLIHADGYPSIAPFALYLHTGDLLIQPPGRLHFPFSLSTVLMTGTMHWHAKTMVQVVQQSLLEVIFSEVTNEEPDYNLSDKFHSIAKEWERSDSMYAWGTLTELNQYRKLIEVNTLSLPLFQSN